MARQRGISRGARLRTASLVALGAAVLVALIVFIPPNSDTATVRPSPSATTSTTPSASASPSATPSPGPTATSAPSPTARGHYANPVLGFSVQLLPPWRRTACLSAGEGSGAPEVLGIDTFTSVPAVEESYGDTGGFANTVSVRVERNPSRLTAEAWARSPRFGSSLGQQMEAATLDGRTGVRFTNDAVRTETTVVAVDDLMYAVELTAKSPSDPSIGEMRAIIASFAFIPRTPAPAATARPARSAEAVADGLAAAFAAKDVAALTALMGDCVISGAEQAGFGSHAPERFAIILRDQFAAGSTVVVRPRPIESAPGYAAGATFSVATTWTDPGQAPVRVDLIIAADGAFHYWRGMVRRQQPPP